MVALVQAQQPQLLVVATFLRSQHQPLLRVEPQSIFDPKANLAMTQLLPADNLAGQPAKLIQVLGLS
jgi:hypothetical protein